MKGSAVTIPDVSPFTQNYNKNSTHCFLPFLKCMPEEFHHFTLDHQTKLLWWHLYLKKSGGLPHLQTITAKTFEITGKLLSSFGILGLSQRLSENI